MGTALEQIAIGQIEIGHIVINTEEAWDRPRGGITGFP